MTRRCYEPLADTDQYILLMVNLSEIARRQGLLTIEDYTVRLRDDTALLRMLRSGLQLIVDGTDPELVRVILELTCRTGLEQAQRRWQIWRNLLLAVRDPQTQPENIATLIAAHSLPSSADNEWIQNFFGECGPALAASVRDPQSARIADFPTSIQTDELLRESLRLTLAQPALPQPVLERALEAQFAQYEAGYRRENDVVIEGLLSIQSGDNPRIVQDKLGAVCRRKADTWEAVTIELFEIPFEEIGATAREFTEVELSIDEQAGRESTLILNQDWIYDLEPPDKSKADDAADQVTE